MRKLILIGMILFSFSAMGSYSKNQINNDIEELFTYVDSDRMVNGKMVDMEHLIRMTAMMESNYGEVPYEGRIAKTYMQLEGDTVDHYLKLIPRLVGAMETLVGRKLDYSKDEDAVFVAYLLYVSKLNYHSEKLALTTTWRIYKVMYNSTKGAATHEVWVRKESLLKQYI